MSYRHKVIKGVTIFSLILCSIVCLHGQKPAAPDTVAITSGELHLKGLLWRPAGRGPFPTVIFCHGNYESEDKRFDVIDHTAVLGPLFAKQGYIFLGLFRRGVGLSQRQGENSADLVAAAFAENGQDERNRIQAELLQNQDLIDITSGLTYLRQKKDVDTNRLVIVGHSYGGSLALVTAEKEPRINLVITFGTAGDSWNLSPELRAILFNAVANIQVPVMLVYAQNDYTLDPGNALVHAFDVLEKPHVLKIYSSFGESTSEGHHFIFLNPVAWEKDIFSFLKKNL